MVTNGTDIRSLKYIYIYILYIDKTCIQAHSCTVKTASDDRKVFIFNGKRLGAEGSEPEREGHMNAKEFISRAYQLHREVELKTTRLESLRDGAIQELQRVLDRKE